jgi:hypothetical protein
MAPKEKAKDLVRKMKFATDEFGYININMERHKQCALIAVDEILDLNLGLSNCDENNWAIDKFYNEVKQEIEKL